MTPPPTQQTQQTQQIAETARVFKQLFSSTPQGARLARLLALHWLNRWEIVYGSRASDSAALLIAELASNAVRHGREPGRDFEVSISLTAATLRIDVSDSHGASDGVRPAASRPLTDGGRGLVLVESLADRWAVLDRLPAGKTVRAELDLPH
ncbi:ATP-binding protein [Streptomyces sp. NBRC 109706]|uniref:ATP-binding protein n=1 Tax=Streptomyces sp. NBRC 109706 TaxID=1550035 RepID=UPI000783B579|nr:ATP-binding protein [Streptomyces sp. NBRC 109706]